jgi:hypothetical protein
MTAATDNGRRVVATYDYHDEHGGLLFQVVRFQPKDFRQRRPDGKGGWVWSLNGVPRVLYRLPELAAAPKDRPVFVVEGEKDADALVALGLLATTAPLGANKWRPEYSEALRGRPVFILPDNDDPGRAHAAAVRDALRGVAESITIVELPGLPEKGDVSDWLAAGGDKDKLLSLVVEAVRKQAKESAPPPSRKRATRATTATAPENKGESVAPVAHVADAAAPWAGDLGELLDRVYDFLGRFISYPSEHARVAHTLWVAHAHAMGAWESTPRLAFLSPEPASGKTRALEITELLVPRPVESVNATPAYLFRKVSDPAGLPTILFDEIDTLFGPKAKENEDVRGMLNAGHRRGAKAGRCVVRGATVETEELPAYCAVAPAGLGHLPDTLLSRSVVVRMRRRAPGEKVEPFRRRVHAPEGHAVRDELAGWATRATSEGLADRRPEMPDGIADRAADVWESLLTVADAAGGDWPGRARVAAVALVAHSRDDGGGSLGVRLLTDLKAVWEGMGDMHTARILELLNALEESPWGDLKGKPLDSRGLARFLRNYGVKPADVRANFGDVEIVRKGYRRADLHDPWRRYLAAAPSEDAAGGVDAEDGFPHDSSASDAASEEWGEV